MTIRPSAASDVAALSWNDPILQLTERLWSDGRLTPQATVAVARLLARLEHNVGGEQARIVLLLGLLAERQAGDDGVAGEVRELIRGRMGTFLELLQRSGRKSLTDALMFLLAHFPEDRARILPVVTAVVQDREEVKRVVRCLSRPSPRDAAGLRWGGNGPSPATWELSGEEARSDRGAARTLDPISAQAADINEQETEALLVDLGVRAAHSIWVGGGGP